MSYVLLNLNGADYAFWFAGRLQEPEPDRYGCQGYLLVHPVDQKGTPDTSYWYALKIIEDYGGEMDLIPVDDDETLRRVDALIEGYAGRTGRG